MLVLSINSKRQRYPNVRLRQRGDVSAAFACGFYQKTKEILVHKRWKPDFLNSQVNEPVTMDEFSKGKSPDFLNLDLGILLADLQLNRENKNSVSSNLIFNLVIADEIDMVKSSINFGTIIGKSRVMKRRGQIQECNKK
ncbi:hypothetical protein Gohar_005251, partial [Gossypium harknessii]|nr:hypothetical protein [Gossypium harknessii]